MTFYHPHPCLIIAFWLGTLFSYLSTIPLLYTLPGKSHRWRSLVGCSPWGRWELDTTERLHFHFSLSCIGEGNGNPLQCSCLENPRDGEAWWAVSMGLHRVGHDWSDLAAAAADIIFLTSKVTRKGIGRNLKHQWRLKEKIEKFDFRYLCENLIQRGSGDIKCI